VHRRGRADPHHPQQHAADLPPFVTTVDKISLIAEAITQALDTYPA
jgi:hypothetical protein